jgi:hypothetical protein
MQEIGDKFSISKERVRQILKSKEIQARKNRQSGITNLTFKERRADSIYQWRLRNNATYAQTAKHFKMAKKTIGKILKDYGYTTPRVAQHGTRSMYSKGCRCELCVEANRRISLEWHHKHPKYPPKRWTSQDDKLLMTYYYILGPTQLSYKLKRSPGAVMQRKINLNKRIQQ